MDGNELISDTKSCEIDSIPTGPVNKIFKENNPELLSDQRPYLYNCRSSVVEVKNPHG